MWLFPYLSWFTVAAMVIVTLSMGIMADTRTDFLLSLVTLAAILVGYEIRKRRSPTTVDPDQPAPTTTSATESSRTRQP